MRYLVSTTSALAFVVLALAGCGDARPARVPVSGRVLIDGRPLPNAIVQFAPPDARPSRARTDAEGRFTLKCFEQDDGAVPGRHRVAVAASQPIAGNKTLWHAPKKYASTRTSDLEQQIDGPADDLLIELTWAGGRPFVEDEETGRIEPYRPGGK